MASDVQTANIQELFAPFHARYEVRPYYVISDDRSAGEGATKRVQSGFEVSVYGVLSGQQLPLFKTEAAHTALDYLDSAARQIASKAGDCCTIEILPRTDSMILDPGQQFQPEGMLQIRISHVRGLGEPAGPSEDVALRSVQGLLRDLGIKAK